MAQLIVPAEVEGQILICSEGLSFWGGVDPDTAAVIDTHHAQFGQALAGRIVLMPTSRGSCSGSGVLLALALNGKAPAALVFREDEDILTLGALIAARMFDRPLAIVRLSDPEYDVLSQQTAARITATAIECEGLSLPLSQT